jgi:hypothetical protein
LTTVPSPPSDPAQLFSLTAPHTITGTISDVVSADEEFTYVIERMGVSSFDGFLTDDNFLHVLFQSHAFQDSARIPEPNTILLLSTAGVAAIARRESLRKRS